MTTRVHDTTRPDGAVATLVALVLARVAFGYQLQTVASLGPVLVADFHIEFSALGTLMGAYMLPGVLMALPCGFLARQFGDRRVVAIELGLMVLGALAAAAASTPLGIGLGRLVSGGGAVALTVLQGKITADRFTLGRFRTAMGILVGAFPLGIGLAQVTQPELAAAFGWPAAFVAGAMVALAALVTFLAGWVETDHQTPRTMRWPPLQECTQAIFAGLIWTAYNAGYFNFLAFMPSLLAWRHAAPWVADVVLPLATWGNLPAILLGGLLARRFGATRVFMVGTLLGAVAVAGPALTPWPLLWGLVFGTVASMHPGLIVEAGTLSARPENRAVGMGLFYTTYYLGGAGIPAFCGAMADRVGNPGGALLAASALSLLAVPFWWLHQRRKIDRF